MHLMRYNRTMELFRKYVDVDVLFRTDGSVIPLAVCWKEGRPASYPIDKILKGPSRMASQAGGCGECYEVMIHGQTRRLYLEKVPSPYEQKTRWFIESRKP